MARLLLVTDVPSAPQQQGVEGRRLQGTGSPCPLVELLSSRPPALVETALRRRSRTVAPTQDPAGSSGGDRRRRLYGVTAAARSGGIFARRSTAVRSGRVFSRRSATVRSGRVFSRRSAAVRSSGVLAAAKGWRAAANEGSESGASGGQESRACEWRAGESGVRVEGRRVVRAIGLGFFAG